MLWLLWHPAMTGPVDQTPSAGVCCQLSHQRGEGHWVPFWFRAHLSVKILSLFGVFCCDCVCFIILSMIMISFLFPVLVLDVFCCCFFFPTCVCLCFLSFCFRLFFYRLPRRKTWSYLKHSKMRWSFIHRSFPRSNSITSYHNEIELTYSWN